MHSTMSLPVYSDLVNRAFISKLDWLAVCSSVKVIVLFVLPDSGELRRPHVPVPGELGLLDALAELEVLALAFKENGTF